MGMGYNKAFNVVRICQRSTRKAIDIQENLVEKSILNRPQSKHTNNDRMNELGSTKEASVKRELGNWTQSKSLLNYVVHRRQGTFDFRLRGELETCETGE